MAFALSGMWMKAGARFAGRFRLLVVPRLSTGSASSAQALRGVALAIGNSAYEYIMVLPNGSKRPTPCWPRWSEAEASG